jgi:hypothetical protein
MLEPDVALTDFLLTAECVVFAALLWRRAFSWLQSAFAVFFTTIALAALAGGLVHGYFPETSTAFRWLWVGTLLSLGGAAAAAWLASAQILVPNARQRWIVVMLALAFALYAYVVIVIRSEFWVAILDYLPATILLTIAFATEYRRHKETAMLAGCIGLVLTFAAAAVQQAQVSLIPRYLGHNASYHLMQAVALALIFIGSQAFLTRRRNAIAS